MVSPAWVSEHENMSGVDQTEDVSFPWIFSDPANDNLNLLKQIYFYDHNYLIKDKF